MCEAIDYIMVSARRVRTCPKAYSCQTEHIWWDQATALKQAGVLPSHVPHPLPDGQQMLRLPVAGVECARLLVDETDGKSNSMFGPEWGVQRSL